jgi:DNA-binding MarR family transcriptional regulator
MEAKAVDLPALFSDLIRLETELWALIDRRLRNEHGLPLSWFEPMQVMSRAPSCRVADVAEALSITVGGTSKIVDRIERAGWCRRTPNPEDGRSSVLRVTPKGRRLLEAAEGTFSAELAAQIAEGAPPAQLQVFAATVRDLREHISDRQGMAR